MQKLNEKENSMCKFNIRVALSENESKTSSQSKKTSITLDELKLYNSKLNSVAKDQNDSPVSFKPRKSNSSLLFGENKNVNNISLNQSNETM